MTKKYYNNKPSRKPLDWNQTSTSTKAKLGSVALRLDQNGYTAKQLLETDKKGNYKIDNQQLKSIFQIKEKGRSTKNTIGFRKNVKQLQFDLDRKRGIYTNVENKYSNMGFKGKKLRTMMTQFNKTVGLNTFFDIAREVKKQYGVSEKQSYTITRNMIDVYNFDKKQLSSNQKAIFDYFY